MWLRCEARSALVVGNGPHSSLGKWFRPHMDDGAKISSYSPGSKDLVRKRFPVRIRAWAPLPASSSYPGRIYLVVVTTGEHVVELAFANFSKRELDASSDDAGRCTRAWPTQCYEAPFRHEPPSSRSRANRERTRSMLYNSLARLVLSRRSLHTISSHGLGFQCGARSGTFDPLKTGCLIGSRKTPSSISHVCC